MVQSSDAPSAAQKTQHAAFFRQSGWLMVANIGGGAMAFAVHFLSKKIPNEQYAIFGVLLMVISCLPTMPLQMVFAQQTASALATNRERQLSGMIRLTWLWICLAWVVAAALVLVFQGQIAARWGLPNPAALWVTLLTVLVSLLSPMFAGLLQGRQDFFWIGWTVIIGAGGRLSVAALAVLVLAGGGTAMLMGALFGLAAGLAIAIWQTRDLWTLPREPFDGWGLLRKLTPLILGFWACQVMFTTDTIFAKAFFTGDELAPYVAAGTLSRALLWLVLPLAAVMFPKLVHSHVKAEKNTLPGIVLAGTAVLAIGGAVGLWVVGPWAVGIVGKPEWVDSAKALLPWYGAAMVPLALANVLANDLLARGRYRVVPFMVLLAAAYCFALPYILNHYPRKLEHVLQTLMVFNFLLFCACAWAAFGGDRNGARDNRATA